MKSLLKKYLIVLTVAFVSLQMVCAQNSLTVKVGWHIRSGFQEGREKERKGGLSYEYLQAISYIANLKYEYVYGDFDTLYEKLCNGEIDVLPGVSKNLESDKVICSEIPEVLNSLNLYCLDESDLLFTKDMQSFSKNRIGIVESDDTEAAVREWIEQKSLTNEIKSYCNLETLMLAFERGDVDVAALNNLDAKSIYHQIASVGEQNFYFGICRESDDVLFEINQALNFLDHQEHNFSEKLYQKYVAPKRNVKITLSEREKKWLKEKKEIKIGCLWDLAPYCVRNAQTGQAEGVLKNFIESMKFNINMEDCVITPVFFTDGQELRNAFDAHEVDALFPVYRYLYNSENTDCNFSNAVMSSSMVFFYLYDLKNSRKARIAVIDHSPSYDYVKRFYPSNDYVLCNSRAEAIKSLKEKRADYFLTDRANSESLQNTESAGKQIFLESQMDVCFAINKSDSFLYTIINRAVSKFSEQDVNIAVSKTLSPNYTAKDFLRDNSVIIIAVLIVLVIALVLAINALGETLRKSRQLAEKQEREQEILEELRTAKKNADAANDAKTLFLFNMSHDIRTPMNAIMGFTNLALKESNNEEKVRDFLHKVQNSSEHLLMLVNDILDMSRIESGRIVIQNTPQNIFNIIDELKDIVYADASAKHQRLLFTVSNISDVNIICDKLRLERILLNLITNAIKYTEAGGEISVKAKEIEHVQNNLVLYEFRVKDNGMGMSKEFLKTIYEPFTRARNSTVSGIPGTGLGMTITKSLVDLMQGSIEIISNEGVGTEVVVLIPFGKCSEDNVINNFKIEKNDVNLNGRRFLLVDDNDYNREIAKLLLEDEGVIVTEACDGKEAVQLVRESEPGNFDLVLMDIQMPEMDGIEATKRIRKLENKLLADIPIIAMTANAFEEDRQKVIAAGMNEHVAKPINMDNIKKIFKKIYG